LRILCQGREDNPLHTDNPNPLHTDAFNVLVQNLKEKIQYGAGPRLVVNVQLEGHYLCKKIAMEIAQIDICIRKRLIKYSL